MTRALLTFLMVAISLLGTPAAQANAAQRKAKRVAAAEKPAPAPTSATAEARLLEIYRLIGHMQSREALAKATSLAQDHPNFQLAQLVYGDLLTAQTRPLRALGDVPETLAQVGAPVLAELRDESHMRLKALRERPPEGTVPSQFLALSSRNKHAIAIDASRSRLYLFANTATGLTLVADYYISLGKLGTEKRVEGDFRTPLGVYFITSNLDPKSLKNFYGTGALPINYPNVLDSKQAARHGMAAQVVERRCRLHAGAAGSSSGCGTPASGVARPRRKITASSSRRISRVNTTAAASGSAVTCRASVASR